MQIRTDSNGIVLELNSYILKMTAAKKNTKNIVKHCRLQQDHASTIGRWKKMS